MSISKIGRRGQLTLPRDVRRRLELEEGDRVAFIEENGGYMLKPLTTSLLELKGAIRVDSPQDFSEIRRRTIEKSVKARR